MLDANNQNEIMGNFISNSFEIAKDFLQSIINPPATEIGLLLADRIRFWRFKNQIYILKQAQSHIEKHDIKVNKIPLKILVPLLENASLEEDENLKNRWINLLINFIDTEKQHKSAIFPFILSQLSTNEAKCLDFMRKSGNFYTEFEDIPKEFKIFDAELSNMIRLGLIRKAHPKIKIEKTSEYISEYDDYDLRYEVTELGYEFVDACNIEEE